MEELISRPFVGQIQFQLVLQKDMGTESAIGCGCGCGYGCECLERVQNFQRASNWN